MTLYEITEQLKTLYDMGEDPDVDAEVLAETMEAVDGDFEEKAESYAKVISNLNADADALKKEIERLTARKRAIDGNVTRIKENLQKAMIATDRRKFKTNLFTFGIQKNPASVVLDTDDVYEVPDEYLEYQLPVVNKAAIKTALKDGINLEGIAHLAQTESLRIK